MVPSNDRHRWQQILNITPDSFSDGGESYSSLDLLHNFLSAYHSGVRCFDFGAQSTAPSSLNISGQQERKRYSNSFFPFIQNICDQSIIKNCKFSFDTFRGETIRFILEYLNDTKQSPMALFWNDISGVVDDDTHRFLNGFPHRYLVLCHNMVNDREASASHYEHQSSLNNDNFIDYLIEYFKTRLSLISDELHSQIIIDPCFGFSKSYEQNLFLLKNIDRFVRGVGIGHYYLFGISRKRFVRQLSGFSMNQLEGLDDFQDNLLSTYIFTQCVAPSFIRAHRCSVGKFGF
jgi:dihydropteroate synthase